MIFMLVFKEKYMTSTIYFEVYEKKITCHMNKARDI